MEFPPPRVRIRQAARYLAVPLKPAPLILIGVLSVLFKWSQITLLLGSFRQTATLAALVYLPAHIVLLTAFFKYSFVLLDSVAKGAKEPPVLSIEMMNPIGEGQLLLFLLLVIALFIGSKAASYWVGPVFAGFFASACLVTLPAMVAVQWQTGSLARSLNLVRCFRLMRQLGRDYLLTLGCIALLSALAYFLTALDLPLVVHFVTLIYAWFAAFALIGGMIFAHREDLEVEDEYEPQSFVGGSSVKLDRLRDKQVDQIYGQWRSGAHENAWQTIVKHLESNSEPIAELHWLYERVTRWPDPRLATRLAQELVSRLLAARSYKDALNVARERLRVDSEFRPLTSSELIVLARFAHDGGDRPTARLLLRDFNRFYPSDAQRMLVEELTQQMQR